MAPRQSRARREPVADLPAPRVRDFGRQAGGSFQIRWDVRTAYDFVFALSDEAGSSDDLPAEDRRWLTRAKDQLSSQVGDAVRVRPDLGS